MHLIFRFITRLKCFMILISNGKSLEILYLLNEYVSTPHHIAMQHVIYVAVVLVVAFIVAAVVVAPKLETVYSIINMRY